MNDWMVYRTPVTGEAQKLIEILQPKFQKAKFYQKPAHWGSLKFFEVRVMFSEKIPADKFVEMGIMIGQNISDL